jgi:hypothetical protein
VSSCKCIKPVCDGRKRCESFKRLSSSPSSRIKEGISAEQPRNLVCTGTRYAVRSENCKLILVPREQRVSVDHRNRRYQFHSDNEPRSYRSAFNEGCCTSFSLPHPPRSLRRYCNDFSRSAPGGLRSAPLQIKCPTLHRLMCIKEVPYRCHRRSSQWRVSFDINENASREPLPKTATERLAFRR